MSGKRNVVVSGLIAAIVAIALLATAVYILPTGITNPSPSGKGTLFSATHRSPTVPQNTTPLYVTYSDVQVHINGAGNNSAWTTLSGSGEINLMSVINASETIAKTSITSGVFNALRFNITDVVVTFNNVNYTAALVYQRRTLTVPIEGGISVAPTRTSAALIYLTPTVILLGTPQNPSFAFIPTARGYAVPSQSATHS